MKILFCYHCCSCRTNNIVPAWNLTEFSHRGSSCDYSAGTSGRPRVLTSSTWLLIVRKCCPSCHDSGEI